MVNADQDGVSVSSRTLDGLQRPAEVSQAGGNTYLIYSSVFGKVLMETNATGAKRKTYVHDLSGGVIAIQQINYVDTQQFAGVRWDHSDPSGASHLQTGHEGSGIGTTNIELDPTDRAVKMFSGDSQDDDDPYGDDKGCKEQNDPLRGSTPENCAEKASEKKDDAPPPDACPGGNWVKISEDTWTCRASDAGSEENADQPGPTPSPTPTPGNCGVNPVTGQPGISRSPANATGNVRSDSQGGGLFSDSRGRTIHGALDIAGVLNTTPVVAPFSGTVIFSGNGGRKAGQTVTINHDNGMQSQLMHMQVGSLIAKNTNGQPTLVNAGDQIGILGNTGNANQPGMQPHVHWLLKDKPGGTPRDPEAVLNSPCPP